MHDRAERGRVPGGEAPHPAVPFPDHAAAAGVGCDRDEAARVAGEQRPDTRRGRACGVRADDHVGDLRPGRLVARGDEVFVDDAVLGTRLSGREEHTRQVHRTPTPIGRGYGTGSATGGDSGSSRPSIR